MLFLLLAPLADDFIVFNLFRYITFRTGGAVMTALLIGFVIGPRLIAWLKRKQGEGQPIRADGPETHLKKKGTPTMGGLMILIAAMVSTILWGDVTNPYLWIVLFVTAGFGLIGFGDDYLKLTKRNPKGLSGRLKLVGQVAIAAVAAIWIMSITREPVATGLAVPFFKDYLGQLGLLFVPFAAFVMVGSSNAVNLTDGLDGLAAGAAIFAFAAYTVIAFWGFRHTNVYSDESFLDTAVVAASMVAAVAGFLWWNAAPARIFMGDTGSLAIGAGLAALALSTNTILLLPIIGGLFVMETVSVIIQVGSFRLLGRRVFRMAPLHHHFELAGWPETTVIIRLWIVAGLFVALALGIYYADFVRIPGVID